MPEDLPPHQTGAKQQKFLNQQNKSPLWCGGLVESFSGIRGLYGRGITEAFAKRYALAYCGLFKDKLSTLVVGGDTRPSTSSLKKAMIEGFSGGGVKRIIDVDVLPTQAIEYAILEFKAQGGCCISASHNEPEYNGWKLLKEDGAILYPEQAEELIEMVHNFKENKAEASQQDVEVVQKQGEAIDHYINFVLETIGSSSLEKIKQARFKVLADPNGGAGIVVLKRLFDKLAVEAKIVNDEIGKFARLIEPKAESLTHLAEKMATREFVLACGFDCDADRVEFIVSPDSAFASRIGTSVVSGHYILALACDAVLAGTRGQVVVTNDATSYLVRDVVKKYQATVKEVEVGETNVVKEMERQKSLIGGEGSSSGAIIPPIKCRDGIMSTALILKMLVEKGKSLLEVLEEYPQYYSDRTKVSCQPDEAPGIKEKLEQHFKEKGYQIKKTGGPSGGLKALADENSFVWFRQSKTEPGIFRIHAEADQNQSKANRLLEEGVKVFNASFLSKGQKRGNPKS